MMGSQQLVERLVEEDAPPDGESGVTVTPEELRMLDVRESVRGYHRRDVDALCQRAADTIEHLQRRQRELAERLERESARRAASEVDAGVIQRTLLNAQRVADEAVADAETRATTLLGDARARADALLYEAETTARRVAEAERLRAETEIVELGGTRDALTADVDALERFATDYRDRIRTAVEAELERVGIALDGVTPPPAPPALTSGPPVPIPAPGEPVDVDSVASGALELATDRGVP